MSSYTFTHVSNSVFTTRIELSNAAVGTVNWAVYFVRSTTSWTSFNLNVPPNASAPIFSFALGSAGFSGNYTYDFRNPGLERLIGSGSISVTPGSTLSLSGTNDPKGSMGIATASGSFTTTAWPTPSWTTGTTLTAATRNRSVSRTVSASPVTSYSLVSSSGATGLSLNTGTGVISGTPTTVGTASLTVRAFNNSSSADRTFTMVINPTPPRVWNGSSFADGGIQVWNGSSFVQGRIRVWNGSSWIDNT